MVWKPESPQIPTQEKETHFEQVVEKGVSEALSKIRERYENPTDPDKALPYHSELHTKTVLSRAERIAKALELDKDERLYGLVRIAAANHDIFQDYQEELPQEDIGGLHRRHRTYPNNEEKSAEEAVEWMKEQKVFTDAECELVRKAILVTVPGHIFSLTQKKQVLYQPNLKPESSLVERSVALADLNTSGMDGVVFTREADALFREFQIDMTRKMRGLKTREELDPQMQEMFRKKMLGWIERQAEYARERQGQIETELEGLDEKQKKAVRALFTTYDEAVAECQKVLIERKKMDFWELAEAVGYPVPPVE